MRGFKPFLRPINMNRLLFKFCFYKKLILLLFLFCSSLNIATSQSTVYKTQIDSLEKIIQLESDHSLRATLLEQQAEYYFFQNNLEEERNTLLDIAEIYTKENSLEALSQTYAKLGKTNIGIGLTDTLIRQEWCNKASNIAHQLNSKELLFGAKWSQADLDFFKTKYNLALQGYLELEPQLKKLNLPNKDKLHMLLDLCATLNSQQVYDSTLLFLEKFETLAEETDQKEDIQILKAQALKIKGVSYLETGALKEAETHLDSALAFFEKTPHIHFENSTLEHKVKLLMNQSNYADALIFNKKIIANNGEDKLSGNNLGTLAIISARIGDKEDAIKYWSRGYEVFLKTGDKVNAGIHALNASTMYNLLKQPENSLKFLEKSKTLARETNDEYLLMAILHGEGIQLIKLSKYRKALKPLNEVLQLYKKYDREEEQYKAMNDIATVYFETGVLDSAMHFNQITQDYYLKTGNNKHVLSNTYLLAYRMAKEKKNYLVALENFEQYKLHQDTIKNEKNKKAIQNARVDEKVVTAKQKQLMAEAEKLKAEKAAALLSSRNKLYSTIALALIGLLLLGYYFFRQLQKSKLQIESQNLQLQQLNTTKDKFFGIIAHDIRSPIMALDGVGEQMQFYLKKNKPEKLEKLTGRIDSTAKRLNSLLDNLLKWALLQQGVIPYHPKELNVQETAYGIFQMFQHNADAKNITLDLQIKNDIKVYADESALNTILRNLVSNAIKFTPEDGTISLSTETRDDKVFINVNDTGTGISAEKLSKLFSLEKTSEKGTAGERGTGLGLTLVKELAELNKGSINVSSVLAKGSSFKVGLPMIE